jgi:hypothetical protein
MTQTLDEIRRRGFAALRSELGRDGMLRFLQQFQLGSGDYAKQRQQWVDRTSLAELQRAAARQQPRRGPKRHGKSG